MDDEPDLPPNLVEVSTTKTRNTLDLQEISHSLSDVQLDRVPLTIITGCDSRNEHKPLIELVG